MHNLDIKQDLIDIKVEDIENPNEIIFPKTEKTIEDQDDPDIKEAKKIIEEWWDVRQIKKLTFDLTEKLINTYQWKDLNLKWLESINQEIAYQLSYFKWRSINLSKVTILDESSAYRLWQFEWDELDLSSVTSLNERTARWVTLFKWQKLYLNSVANLGKMAAEKIAKFEWNTLFLWITNIDEDVAIQLAKFK